MNSSAGIGRERQGQVRRILAMLFDGWGQDDVVRGGEEGVDGCGRGPRCQPHRIDSGVDGRVAGMGGGGKISCDIGTAATTGRQIIRPRCGVGGRQERVWDSCILGQGA